eukprot:GHVU01136862.1.p1 GENE.GHVU01136862.1~~GHVU01136862.1.p1  ORF type:complete len:407 (+),score=44.41 GHVU01136862.1:102-1223(+)
MPPQQFNVDARSILKQLGTPIRNRNASMGSISPVSMDSTGSLDRLTPPCTPPGYGPVSFGSPGAPPGLSSIPAVKKLDRSMSEPAGEKLPKQNVNSSRYKTELCRPFEESGYCKYGDKCQFAHGEPELRNLSRHPKYKTELCRTYHTIGFCPYGPRCHFVHNEDEHKLEVIKANQHIQHHHQLVQHQQQQLLQQQVLQVQKQQAAQRPKALNFSMPMSIHMSRDVLGSTADSPPSSVTDSPSLSPSLMCEDVFSNASLFTPPPASAPAMVNSAFSFQEVPQSHQQQFQQHRSSLMMPLNIQTETIASLAAGLQATSLRSKCTDNSTSMGLRDLWSPPTPPSSVESMSMQTCGSPLDIGKSLRLPIFNRIVSED